MKIYVAVDNPFNIKDNPYVRTLIEGINSQYNDVIWGYGLNEFWNNKIREYDIIHIHWPHYFKTYIVNNKLSIIEFKNRFDYLKKIGIKIVSTCHNLTPHYSNDKLSIDLYDVVYSMSDCIIHLGEYSLSLFKRKFPITKNVILLHHVYDTIYPQLPSSDESIKALKLNRNKRYILCFGIFRDNEERKLIIQLSNYLKKRNISILAPSFIRIPKRRIFLYVIKPLIQYYYYKIKYRNIITTKYYVDDTTLLHYYSASSVSLIQRVKTLNSGNVPLGFLMKNVVVGPNVGNIGVWLKETHNPTFEPNNISSLFKAIDDAMNDNLKGIENYQYALNQLSTKNISSQLYHYYKTLL